MARSAGFEGVPEPAHSREIADVDGVFDVAVVVVDAAFHGVDFEESGEDR